MGFGTDSRSYMISANWDPTDPHFDVLNIETAKGQYITKTEYILLKQQICVITNLPSVPTSNTFKLDLMEAGCCCCHPTGSPSTEALLKY